MKLREDGARDVRDGVAEGRGVSGKAYVWDELRRRTGVYEDFISERYGAGSFAGKELCDGWGHRLCVRFEHGVEGHVQLRPEELTGVLAPPRDEQFFAQVFSDCGAVAWPGEIDLAPDAMHAQIAGQKEELLKVR